MKIEYVKDIDQLASVGEHWLAESKYADFGFGVTVEGIIRDSKEWLAAGNGAVIGLVHPEAGYVGFMTVYCMDGFMGHDPIAFEKYWFVMKEYRSGAMRMYNEANKWAKERGASHFIWSASAMASGMFERLCALYERLNLQPFEKSYICEL